MGICCCKEDLRTLDEEYNRPRNAGVEAGTTDSRLVLATARSKAVDQLILEMLNLIASFVENDEESPVSLVTLQLIADKEDGWIQVVLSMINVIPLDDPFSPSAITIVLDDCPLPSKETVIKLTRLIGLSAERARGELDIRVERNLCVVLGCVAEKLAGPHSVAVLTEDTLNYLVAQVAEAQEWRVALFALIALEKFAATAENRLRIADKLRSLPSDPLAALEKRARDSHLGWRQVGFCAQWALDNLFIVEGRKLSYEIADMTGINVILNTRDVSEYLKISPDGLEARCDSYSFESVRCTFQVDSGCWYYECLIITPGVMQIGWATKNSHFLTYEGYGIGDDAYSVSFDGCRRLVWHGARPVAAPIRAWRPGDILGCLIDLTAKQVHFSLNGETLPACTTLFDTTRYGFFAAASFMAFQQCEFNFGHKPFRYPPTDKQFSVFNQYGQLADDQKKVIPRRVFLEQLRSVTAREDCCTLCCDQRADCRLEPCRHRGFCSVCTSQLRQCPMCRAAIASVSQEGT